MRDLQTIINERQLFESYPIAYIDIGMVKNQEEFIETLGKINKLMQTLNSDVLTTDIIKEKDLTDIKFYISEKLYELRRKK